MKKKRTKPKLYGVHYIREWRTLRKLTLEEVASRMEKAPGELLITSVSVGRIERRVQPYSQPILEALAHALDCSPWELLHVNPAKDGKVIDLLRFIDRADAATLDQLGKIAKAIG